MLVDTTKDQRLRVRAVAGTHAILLGFDMDEADCVGLRGFALHRTDHAEDEAYWLEGMRTFEKTDPGLPPGTRHSTRKHPVQDFSWADYSAKAGRTYSYRVLALEGDPSNLTVRAEAKIDVRTEDPAASTHGVYFNRGAASSQEYARRFGDREPGSVGGGTDPAWQWLSRGAHEAILAFVEEAAHAGGGLRVAAYEFRLPSVLEALKAAAGKGADVQILYDAGHEFPRDDNAEAVDDADLEGLCTLRVPRPLALSHNKFIVRLEGGAPTAVLTGSTNFSYGGVFGQSNVVHVAREPATAAAYLTYWDHLVGNPRRADLAAALSGTWAVPDDLPHPNATTPLFSPQNSDDALEWYAELAKRANDGLFMTFAFGMHPLFQAAYQNGNAKLRYAMLDKLLGPGVRSAERPAAIAAMTALRKLPGNRFAVGAPLRGNALERWLREDLTTLNSHVRYVHTKYMLVDPLGADPIVVTGSANFSKASTVENDENMMIIRGDTRVAHVYLTEFMRLWQHYSFREWAGREQPSGPWHLDTTDGWWQRHFGDGDLSRHRAYFAP
ncbi:MAG: phospholipase D-like domain-containing protein [Myxococcota bacterium]